jgi:arylsulfatase A-like enzyme
MADARTDLADRGEVMVDRRRFLLASATAPAVLAQRRRRPNVLFILADEWRAQATRYNGDTNVQTPVLDRFAAESVNFDMAVSGTPVCCPYRASLLTGQYPLTHGVIVNDVELKPKGVTMGEAFTKAGYRTGWIGKWHVYGSPDGKYGRRLAYIPPEKRFGFDYWKACECTHDYNKSLYYEGNDPTPKYWPGYDAFAQTDDACSFIRRQVKSDDPFCLVLSLGPPHFPLETGAGASIGAYKGREIALRRNVPENLRARSAEIIAEYYAHMSAVDECLDRLLKTLGRRAWWDTRWSCSRRTTAT